MAQDAPSPDPSPAPQIAVFDGHNDLLLRLWSLPPEDRDAAWLHGRGALHMDLPRMRRGGFAGGFFAIYVPSPPDDLDHDAFMDAPPYEVPLPPAIPLEAAQPVALGMAALLMRMGRASGGALTICRNAAEVHAAMDDGRIAALMHMEGAEAIGPDLDALHLFHTLGLRSLGPVWSRPTIFGHGVPFRFPGVPDEGPGLTEAGRALVRACHALGIIVDLSHLNAAGFEDVARLGGAPLVATHSNAHAVCPSTRNLTDRQLAMVRDSDGMVGLNFATVFLRPDGRRSPATGWEPVLRRCRAGAQASVREPRRL
jgi:membrane dipeptidase